MDKMGNLHGVIFRCTYERLTPQGTETMILN